MNGTCPRNTRIGFSCRYLGRFKAQLACACAFATAAGTLAQTDFLRLRSFGNAPFSAATPCSTLIEGTNSVLFGTTLEGGSNDLGTVFRFSINGGSFALLHHFAGNDGANPQAGLLRGTDGALYGTSFSGGASNLGSIFKLQPDGGGFTLLHSFIGGADGANPQAPLVEGTNGALYGMTGGTNATITVFKLNKDGTGYSVLLGTNGGIGFLNVSSEGMLYGTTYNGGISNRGSVFRLDPDGNGFTNLHHFTGGADGQFPLAGVIEGTNGLLYGTTFAGGGSNDFGTVFRLNKDGSGYSVLHSFVGTTVDGWHPTAPLAQGADGAFYGTTFLGGSDNRGAVFKLNGDGSNYSVVRSFNWTGDNPRSPRAGLLPASDGLLYGAAAEGGASDDGALFRLSTDGSGFAVVFNFTWSGGDGRKPMAELLEASDGALYGTTRSGGTGDYGTVFKQNKDGSGYAVLHNFNWNPDGGCPQAGLIEGSDGALYGTAFGGGSTNFGTVFKLNKDGRAFTVLHSFTNDLTDGAYPLAGLLKSTNGLLYGATSSGGAYGFGTIFKLNGDGSGYSVLVNITNAGSALNPSARLIQGSDGILYGAGWNVFKLSADGSGFTNLQESFLVPSADNVLEVDDGALYGTAMLGGGMIFRLYQTTGSNVVLHGFTNVLEGRNPVAGLTASGHGYLYGTTFNGSNTNAPASTNVGTIFRIRTDGGNYEILFSFNNSRDGLNPSASLLNASDSALYGTASAGGEMNSGTIFSLAYPPTLTGLELLSTGALLHLSGVVSRSYAIQATTNLGLSSWQMIAPQLTSTNGLFLFFDLDATNYPARFYRATKP